LPVAIEVTQKITTNQPNQQQLHQKIFDELVKVGKRHELSGGLLIGGKRVADEAARVGALNVLVATPGRLLQHMDESPAFDASGLQVCYARVALCACTH
jgi:superfamily II DNA/RNA helicase